MRLQRHFRAGCRAGPVSTAESLDFGAAAGELVLEPLETTVEVINAIDHGLPLGGKRRDHERDRSAQIGRHDGCPLELLDPLDGCGLAVEMDTRAEPRQL